MISPPDKITLTRYITLVSTLTTLGVGLARHPLQSDGTQTLEYYGSSVATNGSLVMVGAPVSIDRDGFGSVYLYTLEDDYSVSSQVKIFSPNEGSKDLFGSEVAISNDFALIGAPVTQHTATYQGAVYLYHNVSQYTSSTHQPILLKPDDLEKHSQFGSEIAVDGNLAVISSGGAPNHGKSDAGVAYVYQDLSSTSHSGLPSVKLSPTTVRESQKFGFSADISGTNVVVGAPNDFAGVQDAGLAYLYRNVHTLSGTATPNAILKARKADANDHFGYAVGISGDFVVVGAPYDDDGAMNAGAAYLYKFLNQASGTVTETAKLTPSDPVANANFGSSVAVSGDNALIGAPLSAGTIHSLGSVYLYGQLQYQGGNRTEYVKITPSHRENFSNFGHHVALAGDSFLISTSPFGGGVPRVYTGSVSSMLVYDEGNSTQTISGLSFTSNRNWEIGVKTDDNRVILSQGDAATIARNQIVKIGAHESRRSRLDVHGTLESGGVSVGSSGSVLYVADTGVVKVNPNRGGYFSSGMVFIDDGARLIGSGDIQSRVTVAGNGHLSPGNHSVGTLRVGYLDLRYNSVIELDLNAPDIKGGGVNDYLIVNGNLSMLTQLAIQSIGANGLYPVIEYSGALENLMVTIHSVPTGINPGNFSLITSTPGLIQLLYRGNTPDDEPIDPLIPVDLGNPETLLGVQYFDGFNEYPNGIVDGGSGTWNSTSTNWTNAQGSIHSTWGGGVAVFKGEWSRIRLAETMSFNQLYFVDSLIRVQSLGGDAHLKSPGNALIEVAKGAVTIDADLRVQGDFVKTGAGELVLGGQTNTANSVTVGEGMLHLKGNFTSNASVLAQGHLKVNGLWKGNVNNSGTLSGDGLIEGDLVNTGTIEPGNSPGKLNIRGNFTQDGSGTLQIEVGNGSVHDVIQVDGDAFLGGRLMMQTVGKNTGIGSNVPFLKAKRVFGQFDNIEFVLDVGERGKLIMTNDGLVLQIAPQNYVSMALTQNERDLAGVLNQFILSPRLDEREVSANLDTLTPKYFTQAFRAISPDYYQGVLSTGTELSHSHQSLIHQNLNARRLGERLSNVPSMPKAAKAAGTTESMPEVDAASNDYRWSAWTQASGMFSHGGLSLNPGENFESGTIAIGADYLLSDHSAVGAFVSYQEGWSDYLNAGDLDVDAVRFGVYGTYQRDGWYANALLGGGQSSYDIERPIVFASLNRMANSEPDAWEFFTSVSLGYDLQVGNWTFGPQASLQFTTLRFGNVHENGAGALDLHLRDLESESLRSNLGARIAYRLKIHDTLTLIPEVRAFWEHEFIGGDSVAARLGTNASRSFTHHFKDPDEDSIGVGVGVGVQAGPRWYGNVYYNADFGRNDDTNHVISVSSTYRF